MASKPRFAPLVAAAIGVYVVAFLLVRMPSLEGVTERPFPRWFYFLFLLTPEDLLRQWCGQPMRLALFDRAGVLAGALILFGAAAAAGDLVMRPVVAFGRLTRIEYGVFASAIGLNLLSTCMLLLGLSGWIAPAWPVRSLVVTLLLTGVWRFVRASKSGMTARHETAIRHQRMGEAIEPAPASAPPPWQIVAVAVFAVVLLLGAMLPPVEFDVLEYHVQAPKEFFAQGRIAFVPHNVYANMPLGSEMQSLLAMVWTGDPYRGALVGKTVLLFYTLLTAAALYAVGVRLRGPQTGLLAALLYLSIPWIARVSTSGLVEGVYAQYLFLAVFALALGGSLSFAGEAEVEDDTPTRGGAVFVALAGYMAGAAAATKYPAVLFVVFPLAAVIAYREARRLNDAWSAKLWRLAKPVGLFLLVAALGGGAWYAKNAALTGNPTFPLLHGIFGDTTGTWDEASSAQWNRVHRPHDFWPASAVKDGYRVLFGSEWLSPLIVPLASLAFVRRRNRRFALAVFAYIGFVLVLWWLLTHRIDRFWVPVLPLAALLAALGSGWSEERWWPRFLTAVLVVGLLYNGLVVASAAPGYNNRYFSPLDALHEDPAIVGPWACHYNAHRPEGKLLLIGEAAVFHYRVPILYSTCFDDSFFEQIAAKRSPEAIRAALHEHGVSDIMVAWDEIIRYRRPGNYGFSEFFTPSILEQLVDAGVLEPNAPGFGESQTRAYRVR